MKTSELLKRFSKLHGPSGFESEVMKAIGDVIETDADKLEIDRMGNLIAHRNPTGSPKIGIFAHVDEIGAVVSKLEGEGFVRISPVGGVDIKTWLAQRVRISTAQGPVKGVLGVIAPHLTGGRESKEPNFDDAFVNVLDGYERVKVGDPITLDVNPVELSNNTISGKAFDNRAGCAALVRAMNLLKRYVHRAGVVFVFNTTEEVGGPGAQTSAYRLGITHAIIVDTTFANEKAGEVSEIALGEGPAIGVGPSCDPEFVNFALEIAENLKIPHQVEALPGRSGTDSDHVQLVRAGVKTLVVTIPLKYMHTPCEVVSVEDVETTARLLVEIVSRL